MLISLVFDIILFVLSFLKFESDHTRHNFTYENGLITFSSWKTVISDIISVYMVVTIVIFIFLCVIAFKCRKNGEAALGKLFLNFIMIILTLFVCFVTCDNFNDSPFGSEYNPVFYEFTDNKHKIVICEETFLLGGWGTVYQVYEDNTAYPIGSFSTDDGYRNNGNYELEWSDNGINVIYNYGNKIEKKQFYEFTD